MTNKAKFKTRVVHDATLNVVLPESFKKFIEECCEQLGEKRSAFIRTAILDRLKTKGFDVSGFEGMD